MTRKLTDCMGPLSPDNIDAQFCSDWLKDEIRRVFKELAEANARAERAEAALEDIHSHGGKTLLADCCVSKSCSPHYVDGDKVSECAYQYGVFDGYATTAAIAEEALAALRGGDK